MNFVFLCLIGFVFGIGFGFFVQRAGLCFAHGLGEIFVGKGKRVSRLFIVVFIITAIGFMVSGYISPSLGLKTIGQIRGYGFYNLVSGMLFGAGIFISGGCILGTLRQIGEGNITFIVVMISFIPGMAFVVNFLNPVLEHGYNVQNLLLPDLFWVSAIWITLFLCILAAVWFALISKKKR